MAWRLHASRSKPSWIFSCAVILLLVFFRLSINNSLSSSLPLRGTIFEPVEGSLQPRDAAANATLGFQRILVLSQGTPWRIHGLQAAAEQTGLEITVLEDLDPSNEEVETLRLAGSKDVSHPSRGQARAWRGHLDLLNFIVKNKYESALILEDDVDWDAGLLNQMKLVSDGVRNFTKVDANDNTPYGHSWDILWLGHCGDARIKNATYNAWHDPTVVSHSQYTGWSKEYISQLPEGARSVIHSQNPICTFGYAVSRLGAMRALRWARHGEGEAFDIKLCIGCINNFLNCLTIVPEIMHHYVPPEKGGASSEIFLGDSKGNAVNDNALLETNMGTTRNILTSARCQALFNERCLAIDDP